jgi:dienelactone hydrolase
MLTPIRIDNRLNGFLGRPGGADKRPAVIHLHERYGIVQHTTDWVCSHFSGQASSRARCEVAICFNWFHRPAL